MEIPLKESRMEKLSRSWLANPILGKEYTEDSPLHDVFVGVLRNKRDISTVIVDISSILPGFNYLKRCSGDRILLAPLGSRALIVEARDTALNQEDPLTEDEMKALLMSKGFPLSLLHDHFQVVKVPSRAAKTKQQALNCAKLWPVNFHPDPFIEKMIDGSIFDEDQLTAMGNYTRVAIEAAQMEAVGTANCTGSTVVVDPEDGRILAIAASRINEHPMWHASMLAIDLVARLQGGGAWKLEDEVKNCKGISNIEPRVSDESNSRADTCEEETRTIKRKYEQDAPLCYPASLSKIDLPLQKCLLTKVQRKGRRNNGQATNAEANECPKKSGPYLSTGYWVFCLIEPCPMCAMALLHSRVSRIFYGVPNLRVGILGTKEILHTVPGLNHRYCVWSGIMERECEKVAEEMKHKNVG